MYCWTMVGAVFDVVEWNIDAHRARVTQGVGGYEVRRREVQCCVLRDFGCRVGLPLEKKKQKRCSPVKVQGVVRLMAGWASRRQ
jgi:hypothetical protein